MESPESTSPDPGPESQDSDDLKRVAAVLAQVEGALADWFRSEHPRVYRLCLGFLLDESEAEDLAQDAMLHLHDRLHRFDPSRSYGPWRNTLVLNLCRDRTRRRETRRAAEAQADPLPARLPTPEDAARAGELRGILVRALGTLSEREREAFVLRDLEGQSTERVAETLGIGASSVRSLVTLARRRMRNLLGEHLPSPTTQGGSA